MFYILKFPYVKLFDYLQIALVVQEWYLKESPYTLSILVNGRQEILECIMDSHQILMDFSYPIVLLGLQLLISPFIINSRRNYKEGMYFINTSICTVLKKINTMKWHVMCIYNASLFTQNHFTME